MDGNNTKNGVDIAILRQTQNIRDYNETEESLESLNKIEVFFDDDAMTAYVKIEKPGQNQVSDNLYDRIYNLLADYNIVYGVRDDIIRRLFQRPVYNLKMEIAKGLPAVNGENGEVTYFVKKNSEYSPDYNKDGPVDYKNLDYLQLVSKGQVLCEIKKETPGTEGINIFGKPVYPRPGKPPVNPAGDNTELTEDGKFLVAAEDGQVDFVRDKVNIQNVLRIKEHVNMVTGNVNFSGNIIIGGDVQSGFSVHSGGNVAVNGVIESADIGVGGHLQIGKGVNGIGTEPICVGGDLKCRYIENADIFVEGNITADYIINSKIYCNGNIYLKGSKEVIAGGEIWLRGELIAREIGSESERPTLINFIETVTNGEEEEIQRLKCENEEYQKNMTVLSETASKFLYMPRRDITPKMREQLEMIKEQVMLLKEQIDENIIKINKLEDQSSFEYHGSVSCKNKLYRGVKINFGKQRFRFKSDSLEHCRIFWSDGEIIQGTL